MNRSFTEPRREALQNVARGIVYRRTTRKVTWMLDGAWQPPPQQPYNWLYAQNYIELLASSGRAQLSTRGKEVL